jgi:hypothetical protein
LVDLHGHTPGSQGMLLRAPSGPILLTGDAAWVDESWLYAATPVWADDMDAWWDQIWRIKKFAQLVPQLLVVAGHDVSRVRKEKRTDLVLHEQAASRKVAMEQPSTEGLPVRELDPVAVGIADDAEVADDGARIERSFYQDPVVLAEPGQPIDLVAGAHRIADVGHGGGVHGVGVIGAEQDDDEAALASRLSEPHDGNVAVDAAVDLDQPGIALVKFDRAIDVTSVNREVRAGGAHFCKVARRLCM